MYSHQVFSIMCLIYFVEKSVQMRPNNTNILPCSQDACQLPYCFCSVRHLGDEILEKVEIPQMVLLSFVGPIDADTQGFIQQVSEFNNPTGCPVSVTLSVTDVNNTDPCLTQRLFVAYHEIAISSASERCPITQACQGRHIKAGRRWTKQVWSREIRKCVEFLTKKAEIKRSSLKTYSTPNLQAYNNLPWSILHSEGLKYDTSVRIDSLSFGGDSYLRFWPHTTHFSPLYNVVNGAEITNQFHTWMVPNNPFNTKDGWCETIFECPAAQTVTDISDILLRNLDEIYSSNRAPMLITIPTWWLTSNKESHQGLLNFVEKALDSYSAAYFVTVSQTVDWIRKSTELDQSLADTWNCDEERVLSKTCVMIEERMNSRYKSNSTSIRRRKDRPIYHEPLFKNNIVSFAILFCTGAYVLSILYDRWGAL